LVKINPWMGNPLWLNEIDVVPANSEVDAMPIIYITSPRIVAYPRRVCLESLGVAILHVAPV